MQKVLPVSAKLAELANLGSPLCVCTCVYVCVSTAIKQGLSLDENGNNETVDQRIQKNQVLHLITSLHCVI